MRLQDLQKAKNFVHSVHSTPIHSLLSPFSSHSPLWPLQVHLATAFVTRFTFCICLVLAKQTKTFCWRINGCIKLGTRCYSSGEATMPGTQKGNIRPHWMNINVSFGDCARFSLFEAWSPTTPSMFFAVLCQNLILQGQNDTKRDKTHTTLPNMIWEYLGNQCHICNNCLYGVYLEPSMQLFSLCALRSAPRRHVNNTAFASRPLWHLGLSLIW